MIISDYDRYPESRQPDLFLAAARVLCGELPSPAHLGQLTFLHAPIFGGVRRHPLDVARDQLVREVRELLGDRALPCNCGAAENYHAVYCVTAGRARTVEQSERWKIELTADIEKARRLQELDGYSPVS